MGIHDAVLGDVPAQTGSEGGLRWSEGEEPP